jgi:pimeloyl-ACP methyl ester carboxylesterase
MWRPLMKELGKTHLVVAPDLRGFGDSAKPESGYDKKTMAQDVHALAQSLGIQKAGVAGHDIGLMVAYAYAAQFPDEVEKLVVMDAFLPGVDGWEDVYNNPGIWHFRFNGEYPEKLVQGREHTYFEYFWNVLAADKTRSLPEADRKAYTEAYSKPGRMRAAWAYFASWPQLAKDFAQLSQTKLTVPVLSIGGEKSLGNELAVQMKLVATDVTVVVLKDTGHWILEERPKETTDALVKFL